jgi:pimeloyl-ACP methyl ester carboxylesterase
MQVSNDLSGQPIERDAGVPTGRVALQVRASDGTCLSGWRMAEPSAKTTCLLLHGSGDGAYVWEPLSGPLAALCPTIALDFRGHGNSERTRREEYCIATHVRDVESALEQLQLRSAIVCGHSLGGQVAVQIAAGRMAQRIRGVVIVDVCPQPSPVGTQQAALQLRQSLRRYESIEEYQDWLLASRPLLSAAMSRQLALGALRPNPCGGFELKIDPAVCDAVPREANGMRGLQWHRAFAAIECPALLIRGVASAMVSAATAHSTLGLLRQGSLVTVPRAGHAVMSDNPEDFAAGVLAFVRALTHVPLD